MNIKLALCLAVFLLGCGPAAGEKTLLEDVRIREFMVEYLRGESKAEVWARRSCSQDAYYLCNRDHLSLLAEVAYVKWLKAKKRSEMKRSETKINEGEEEETK